MTVVVVVLEAVDSAIGGDKPAAVGSTSRQRLVLHSAISGDKPAAVGSAIGNRR